MSYSHWLMRENFLMYLDLRNLQFTPVFEVINHLCNKTIEITQRSCTNKRFMYQCSSENNRISLFSCAGHIENGCSGDEKACQTAGKVDPVMLQCIQQGIDSFAEPTTMHCFSDNDLFNWLPFVVGFGLPVTAISLCLFYRYIQKTWFPEIPEKVQKDMAELEKLTDLKIVP